MAKKVYEEENIRAIAEKIREKTVSDTTYKTSEMPKGIDEVYEQAYGTGYGDGIVSGSESGYNEGYEAGKNSMIDESKIIEKTASGIDSISVDDVSEIPHEIKVQLSSDTITDFSGVNIQTFGFNLWDEQAEIGSINVSSGQNVDTITTQLRSKNYIRVQPSTAYYIKCPNTTLAGGMIQIYRYDENMNYLGYGSTGVQNQLLIMGADWAYIRFVVKTDYGTKYNNDICINYNGRRNGEYEPYKGKTYTPNTNGTIEGVTSIAPKMNLQSDTEGVNISMTYHKSYGMQTEYDKFWDSFQTNGERKNYAYGFSGVCWNDETYNPKYPINADNATGIFSQTSGITSTKVPISINKVGTHLFSGCTDLKEIPLIKVVESIKYDYCFNNCRSLENITFTNDSVIANDVSFAPCSKLTHDSLMSIIGALKPFVTYEEVITDFPEADIYCTIVDAGYKDNYYEWWEISKIAETSYGVLVTLDGAYPYPVKVLTGINATTMDEVPEYLKNATHYQLHSMEKGFSVKSVEAVPTGETRTLTLGETNLAKLTEAEKKIATDKGWILA